MEINVFVSQFANQFANTDSVDITAGTNFWELDEWSSLVALSVVAMIDDEYGVTLRSADIKGVKTVGQLYDVVVKKMAQ